MSGEDLQALPSHMPNGSARRNWIVGGRYCSDTRYAGKLQGKEAQHQALQATLQDHGYNVTALLIILGVSGSRYHTTKDALKQIGIEHTKQKAVVLHKHAVTSLHM